MSSNVLNILTWLNFFFPISRKIILFFIENLLCFCKGQGVGEDGEIEKANQTQFF